MAGIPVSQVHGPSLVSEVLGERGKSVSVSSEETVTEHAFGTQVPISDTIAASDTAMRERDARTFTDSQHASQQRPSAVLGNPSVLRESEHISSNTDHQSAEHARGKHTQPPRVHVLGADYVVPLSMIEEYSDDGLALERIVLGERHQLDHYRQFLDSVAKAAFSKSFRKLKKRSESQIQTLTKSVQQFHDSLIVHGNGDPTKRANYQRIHAEAKKGIIEIQQRLDSRKNFMRKALEFWKRSMLDQHRDFLCSEVGSSSEKANQGCEQQEMEDEDISRDPRYQSLRSQLESARSVRDKLMIQLEQAQSRLRETSSKLCGDQTSLDKSSEDEKMQLNQESDSQEIGDLLKQRLEQIHSESVFELNDEGAEEDDGSMHMPSEVEIHCEWLKELNDRLREIQELRSLDIGEVRKSLDEARRLKERVNHLKQRRDMLREYLSEQQ